jgi:hypothetical protein
MRGRRAVSYAVNAAATVGSACSAVATASASSIAIEAPAPTGWAASPISTMRSLRQVGTGPTAWKITVGCSRAGGRDNRRRQILPPIQVRGASQPLRLA